MSAVIGGRQAFWTYWLSYSAPFQLLRIRCPNRQTRDPLKDPWLMAYTRPIIDASAPVHE